MRTPKQQAASRANGALSRGPVTPMGKRRSSANARRHGLLARTTVLENESRAGFNEQLLGYIERIDPRDAVELAAVEEMCSAAWRMRRIWTMERMALDLELGAQPAGDELERIVRAFDSLARNRPHFLLFHRYETRLHNIIQRSLNCILALRKCGVPNELGCPGIAGTPANENERRRGGVRGVSYPEREKVADSGNGAQLGL